MFFIRAKNMNKKIPSPEGMPLEGTFWQSSLRNQGALSIEAAIVIPLFLFFFWNLIALLEIIGMHGNFTVALWNAGNQLSMGSAIVQESEIPEEIKPLLDFGIPQVFVKNQVESFLGAEYLENAPLAYGKDGLLFLGSEVVQNQGIIDIVMTTRVSMPISALGGRSFLMESRYYGHDWSGYHIEENADGSTVYVTEDTEVYHLYRDCSHIYLVPEKIPSYSVAFRRNSEDKSYRECELCKRKPLGYFVWVTAYGKCYHRTEDCPSIRRTVYEIDIHDVKGLRLCQRCGKREGDRKDISQ